MNDSGFSRGRKTVGKTVAIKAPAKVNLHLEIVRQRHDGYHEIETVFQAISLFDTVEVGLTEQFAGGEPNISISVFPEGSAPNDETNLCWQAARHFCREMGLSGDINIHLVKTIPSEAGLGGGSSDAAAVLKACDNLFETRLSDKKLEELGSGLGADVPFFIKGGTALGRGIGTILTSLPSVRTGQFLIAKPPLKLKAAEVYGNLKMGLTVNSTKANIQVMKPILVRFPQDTWPGFNRLESVVLPQQPALQRLVLRLQELAPVAMLSGSGSAVVGVFPDGEDLTELVAELEADGLFVRIVGPYGAGVIVQ